MKRGPWRRRMRCIFSVQLQSNCGSIVRYFLTIECQDILEWWNLILKGEKGLNSFGVFLRSFPRSWRCINLHSYFLFNIAEESFDQKIDESIWINNKSYQCVIQKLNNIYIIIFKWGDLGRWKRNKRGIVKRYNKISLYIHLRLLFLIIIFSYLTLAVLHLRINFNRRDWLSHSWHRRVIARTRAREAGDNALAVVNAYIL